MVVFERHLYHFVAFTAFYTLAIFAARELCVSVSVSVIDMRNHHNTFYHSNLWVWHRFWDENTYGMLWKVQWKPENCIALNSYSIGNFCTHGWPEGSIYAQLVKWDKSVFDYILFTTIIRNVIWLCLCSDFLLFLCFWHLTQDKHNSWRFVFRWYVLFFAFRFVFFSFMKRPFDIDVNVRDKWTAVITWTVYDVQSIFFNNIPRLSLSLSLTRFRRNNTHFTKLLCVSLYLRTFEKKLMQRNFCQPLHSRLNPKEFSHSTKIRLSLQNANRKPFGHRSHPWIISIAAGYWSQWWILTEFRICIHMNILTLENIGAIDGCIYLVEFVPKFKEGEKYEISGSEKFDEIIDQID